MKKKGLIVATIVMVLVLAVSLTTATYAWFSSAAYSSVDQIAMNVGAASSVAIGVNKVALTEGNKTTITSYSYGEVVFDGTKWNDGAEGLGTSISTGMTLNVGAGVGSGQGNQYSYTAISQADMITANYIELSGNDYVWKSLAANTLYLFDSSTNTYSATTNATPYDASKTYYTRSASADQTVMDPEYTPAHALYTASGNSFDKLDTPAAAIINANAVNNTDKNTDVIDLQMAINPSKAGVYGTYCVITIKPIGSYVGMISALWADITVGSTTVTGIDLFDLGAATDVHYNNQNAGTYTFYFMIDKVTGTEMTANDTTVTPFSIRLFISGYDEDCNLNATNTSATIDLQFYAVEKEGSNYKPYAGLDDLKENATEGVDYFAVASALARA